MDHWRQRFVQVAVLAFILTAPLFHGTNAVGDELSTALDSPVQTDGATPLSFTTGTAAPWFASTSTYTSGLASAQSGTISNSQYTRLETAVTGTASVSFYQKVSSEPTYDGLAFYIDTFATP